MFRGKSVQFHEVKSRNVPDCVQQQCVLSSFLSCKTSQRLGLSCEALGGVMTLWFGAIGKYQMFALLFTLYTLAVTSQYHLLILTHQRVIL